MHTVTGYSWDLLFILLYFVEDSVGDSLDRPENLWASKHKQINQPPSLFGFNHDLWNHMHMSHNYFFKWNWNVALLNFYKFYISSCWNLKKTSFDNLKKLKRKKLLKKSFIIFYKIIYMHVYLIETKLWDVLLICYCASLWNGYQENWRV